jgi:hypothetical protein
LVDRLTERVVLDAQRFSDFVAWLSGVEKLLGLGDDFRRHHRGATTLAGAKETLDAFFPIFLHTPADAVFRDGEGPHDLGLLAYSQANQLAREHAKRLAILHRMMKNGVSPMEVPPPPVFGHHREVVINSSGTFGNDRQ